MSSKTHPSQASIAWVALGALALGATSCSDESGLPSPPPPDVDAGVDASMLDGGVDSGADAGGDADAGHPPVRAFPGAEGFGADTPGGRGGRVVEVTTTDDVVDDSDDEVSLREALSIAEPRIVVFRVGGTIQLTEDLDISSPFVTVAGQTAPGDGVLIRGAALRVSTHDVIVRGLRIRVGDEFPGPDPENRDGLAINNDAEAPYNVIFDHCSASWTIDEIVQLWFPCQDITVQWCLLAEGLADSLHPEGIHSKALLVGDHAKRISVHHNLFAHNIARNPLLKGDTESEVINNVVYNWGYGPTHFVDPEGSGPSRANVIGNTYLPGVDSNGQGIKITDTMAAGTLVYVEGNVGPGRESDLGDDWLAVEGDEQYRSMTPIAASSGIDSQSAAAAYDLVTAAAGAIVPARDAVDQRIVQSVIDRTGASIDSQNDVGGWPALADGTAPTDTDHDGMPDTWETAHDLDPSDASDGSDEAPSGYTWVEEYINGLIPVPTG